MTYTVIVDLTTRVERFPFNSLWAANLFAQRFNGLATVVENHRP